MHAKVSIALAVLLAITGLASAEEISRVSSSNSKALPEGQSLISIDKNPYFEVGLSAAGKGLSTFSLTLEISSAKDLTQRINLVHLGMKMSGWRFVGQNAIDINGTTTQVLLTYQR